MLYIENINTQVYTYLTTPSLSSSLSTHTYPYLGSEMISFIAWSHVEDEGVSVSRSRSRNACFASSLVAYCGLFGSLCNVCVCVCVCVC